MHYWRISGNKNSLLKGQSFIIRLLLRSGHLLCSLQRIYCIETMRLCIDNWSVKMHASSSSWYVEFIRVRNYRRDYILFTILHVVSVLISNNLSLLSFCSENKNVTSSLALTIPAFWKRKFLILRIFKKRRMMNLRVNRENGHGTHWEKEHTLCCVRVGSELDESAGREDGLKEP